jgi:DNA-binding response OmpR family regulator
MKILIIEDERSLAEDISRYLSGEHYLCEIAATYAEAIEKIELYSYDCILLDIMLPDGNGLDVLKHIKEIKKRDGVIILSAKDAIDDRVKGLQLGADDYLPKPFHHSELAARIFSVIRRKYFDNANVFTANEISVDLLANTVTVNGIPLQLTKKEYALLLLFLGNRGKTIPKSALAEHLSGDLADMLDNHDFVYAHVKNLKKKLSEGGAKNYIKTMYGIGYKWES